MINKTILLKELGAKIKSIRVSNELSQEELADICEFDRTYISLLETGKRNPSYFNLMKLCNGLKINLNELLEQK
jgi:transcriptional regulator with XRE-family HTH domain